MFGKDRENERIETSETIVHFLHDEEDNIMTGLLKPDYLPRKDEGVILNGKSYVVHNVVYHFRNGRGNYVNIYLTKGAI